METQHKSTNYSNRKIFGVVGYFAFFLFQVLYPLVFTLWHANASIFFYTYPVPAIIAFVAIIKTESIPLIKVTRLQLDFLGPLTLTILCILFTSYAYEEADNSEYSAQAFTSYLCYFLCTACYSLFGGAQFNIQKYAIVQISSIMRIILYANRCVKIIRRDNQQKDYDLLVMATEIALYAFYIEQVKKHWEKSRQGLPKEDSLLSLEHN